MRKIKVKIFKNEDSNRLELLVNDWLDEPKNYDIIEKIRHTTNSVLIQYIPKEINE